jgi:hypothetical protein
VAEHTRAHLGTEIQDFITSGAFRNTAILNLDRVHMRRLGGHSHILC